MNHSQGWLDLSKEDQTILNHVSSAPIYREVYGDGHRWYCSECRVAKYGLGIFPTESIVRLVMLGYLRQTSSGGIELTQDCSSVESSVEISSSVKD